MRSLRNTYSHCVYAPILAAGMHLLSTRTFIKKALKVVALKA